VPEEKREDKLFICEYCFKYTAVEKTFRVHQVRIVLHIFCFIHSVFSTFSIS
jgi:hypothetical protein